MLARLLLVLSAGTVFLYPLASTIPLSCKTYPFRDIVLKRDDLPRNLLKKAENKIPEE